MVSLITSLLWLVLLIAGIVAVVRYAGRGKQIKSGDAYFYFMAFVALIVLFWGTADLVRVILEKWWVGGSTGTYYSVRTVAVSNEKYLRDLSLRISAILVAVPIWYFHWHKAVSRPKEELDEAGKRVYSFAVMLASGLSSIGMLIGAVYLAVNAMLGITLSNTERQSLAFLLPYSIGALALWWTHWKMWHESREKPEAEVSSQQPAVSSQ